LPIVLPVSEYNTTPKPCPTPEYVDNRWLSTYGRYRIFYSDLAEKTAQNYLPIDGLIYPTNSIYLTNKSYFTFLRRYSRIHHMLRAKERRFMMLRWMLIGMLTFFTQVAWGAELTRSKALELLDQWNAKWLSEQCRLAPALATKPEFVALKDRQYCKGKFVVTGIQPQSPTAASVEFHTEWVIDKAWLQSWLDAMQKLQQRLAQLPVQRSCDIPSKDGRICWSGDIHGEILQMDIFMANNKY